MTLLDAITFGYMAIAIIQAKDPQKSSGEVAVTTLMGIFGALCGAVVASFVFGIQIPYTPSNLLIAATGLFFLRFLGSVVREGR